jgi:hypothetical protein
MDRDKRPAMDQWAQEIKRSGSWNTVNDRPLTPPRYSSPALDSQPSCV